MIELQVAHWTYERDAIYRRPLYERAPIPLKFAGSDFSLFGLHFSRNFLRIQFPGENSVEYNTFADLIPLLIATPAAWLGYCFQRRQSYLKDVRDLWTKLVATTQEAIQYTHLPNPSQSDFAKVQKSLSVAIDELRGVFLNIGHSGESVGLYPFESIKKIQKSVSSLGFGEAATAERARQARNDIVTSWKELRNHFLSECARGVPVRPDSPYLQ